MLESEGEEGEEGEDHMEDRFEGISFPRIITTSSISPYNEGVTRQECDVTMETWVLS